MTEAEAEVDVLHPSFFVIGEPSERQVVFSFDGTRVLACSHPLAKVGEGSAKIADSVFKRLEDKQICLLCRQTFKSTSLWTSRSHLIHCHQMLCDIDELSKHNSKWVESTIQAWEKAIKGSLDKSQLLGKRPMDTYLVDRGLSSTQQKQDLRRNFVVAISRGLLPFSFVNSPGVRHLINSISKSPVDMTGLSRRSITRATEQLYSESKRSKNAEIQRMIEALKNLCKREDNLVSGSHDIWSSIAGRSFMGFNLHAMDVTSKPWRIAVATLACAHHPSPHTAVRNLERAKQILSDWDLDVCLLQAATQDTTGNSIATFQSVDATEIMPCCAHTSQLFIQHSCDKVPLVKDAFDNMNVCATKFRGYPKRAQELFRLCRQANIKELMPRKICAVRWNTRAEVASRAIEITPAYRNVNPVEVFDKVEARDGWTDAFNVVESNIDVIAEILPLMKLNAQWTQILSSKAQVTISLVRLAIRSLRSAVTDLENKVREYQQASAANRSLAAKLSPFCRSATQYVDHYFGDQFYDYGLLRVAEFLDPRTVWCIEDPEELKLVARALKQLANPEDVATPPIRNAKRPGLGLAAASNSRLSPLDKEISLYTNSMIGRGEEACNATNPLEFWGDGGATSFPILAGIAARVLSIPATSASVEQLFSVAGRVVTTARARLNFRHVNELCCLHQWLIDEGVTTKDAREATEKRARAFEKFAFLNLRREVEQGPEEDDSDDDEDVDYEGDNEDNLVV